MLCWGLCLFGVFVCRGENSMILWINGDWIMGQGVLCVKCNLVLGEVLW